MRVGIDGGAEGVGQTWRSFFLDILRDDPSLIERFRAAAAGDADAKGRLLELVADLLEGLQLFSFHMDQDPVIERLRDAVAEFDRCE